MSRLEDALAWTGVDATLSMFVVSAEATTEEFDATLPGPPPDHIRTYDLEDEAGVLGGRHIREFDLVWKDLPEHLEEIVTTCLREVMAAGSKLAWFGFEGSFDYDHLLHPDIADQIYAVGANGQLWLAIEDKRRQSKEWKTLLAELRRQLLPPEKGAPEKGAM